MSTGECAVWYRVAEGHRVPEDKEMYPEVFVNEGQAAWDAAESDRVPGGWQTTIGVQFPDGRTFRKEDWPAYAEAVRFLEVRYRRPGVQGGDPLPEVRFACPFTGERLRRYGAPEWLGVSQERLDPGAFTAYVRAKEAAGEWKNPADTVTRDQLREALSEMPAGDDGRAWLESALSRR